MVNPGESVFFGSPAPASMQRGMRSPSTPLSTGGARYLDGGFGESAWGAGGSTPAQREAGGGYGSSAGRLTRGASLAEKTTPPPPPIDSMWDRLHSPEGNAAASPQFKFGDATSRMSSDTLAFEGASSFRGGGGGDVEVSSSSAGGGSGGGAAEDCWVTVYGIGTGDTALVLREMQKCGDIVDFGTFGPAQANWLHVRFQSRYEAKRALGRSGEQVSPSLIIGVKLLGASHRQAVANSAAGGAAGGAGLALPTPSQAAKALGASRPYRVEAAPAEMALPQRSRTVWAKIEEYVLGL